MNDSPHKIKSEWRKYSEGVALDPAYSASIEPFKEYTPEQHMWLTCLFYAISGALKYRAHEHAPHLAKDRLDRIRFEKMEDDYQWVFQDERDADCIGSLSFCCLATGINEHELREFLTRCYSEGREMETHSVSLVHYARVDYFKADRRKT